MKLFDKSNLKCQKSENRTDAVDLLMSQSLALKHLEEHHLLGETGVQWNGCTPRGLNKDEFN